MNVFVKRRPSAPAGFFASEAAGLRWLSDVDGGVARAEVLRHDEVSLTLRRLESVRPSREAAQLFGARLAITHNAGAAAFGAGPYGWTGPGFFGPVSVSGRCAQAGRAASGCISCTRCWRTWSCSAAVTRPRPKARLAACRRRTAPECRWVARSAASTGHPAFIFCDELGATWIGEHRS